MNMTKNKQLKLEIVLSTCGLALIALTIHIVAPLCWSLNKDVSSNLLGIIVVSFIEGPLIGYFVAASFIFTKLIYHNIEKLAEDYKRNRKNINI